MPRDVGILSGMPQADGNIEFMGKRALVTGGSKGIGQAIVERLRAAGATVIATARSKPSTQSPDAELFIEADLSTSAGAAKVISHVQRRFGGVDILVNNVGGSSAPPGGFAALTDQHWHDALETNLLSAA